MTPIERLSELLDEKERELEEAQEEIINLERANSNIKGGLFIHRDAKDDGVLPVPRLEFEWSETYGKGSGAT